MVYNKKKETGGRHVNHLKNMPPWDGDGYPNSSYKAVFPSPTLGHPTKTFNSNLKFFSIMKTKKGSLIFVPLGISILNL